MSLRVVVVGAGGVGGYFGARLAQGGCDVGFVARGQQLAALRSRGLQIESALGDFRLTPARATADASELGPSDVVLICVKLLDTEFCAAGLSPMLRRGI